MPWIPRFVTQFVSFLLEQFLAMITWIQNALNVPKVGDFKNELHLKPWAKFKHLLSCRLGENYKGNSNTEGMLTCLCEILLVVLKLEVMHSCCRSKETEACFYELSIKKNWQEANTESPQSPAWFATTLLSKTHANTDIITLPHCSVAYHHFTQFCWSASATKMVTSCVHQGHLTSHLQTKLTAPLRFLVKIRNHNRSFA